MVKIKLFLICGLVIFLLGGGLSPIIRVLALISFSFLLCLEIYEDYNKLRVLNEVRTKFVIKSIRKQRGISTII